MIIPCSKTTVIDCSGAGDNTNRALTMFMDLNRVKPGEMFWYEGLYYLMLKQIDSVPDECLVVLVHNGVLTWLSADAWVDTVVKGILSRNVT